MSLVALSVEGIERLHTEQIRKYGGSPGLRDRGLLESAAARSEMLEHFVPDVSIGAFAATVGFGLIKNHAFIDGNKRVGLEAVVTTLKLNGFRLNCSEEEAVSTVQRVAASEISEQEWTAWVVAHSKLL